MSARRSSPGNSPPGKHEFDLVGPDGDRTPVELRYAALPDSEWFRGTTGVMRDVTERREREAELRKAHCRVTTIANDAGGRLRSLVATDDSATITLDLPADAEVRTVVEAVDAVYPGTALQARREQVSPDLPRTVGAALRERCTDRQYEALTGAYYSGCYDWPRLTTVADLADRAGVSSPTFQYHLRTGERKLLDVVIG